jgi:hypothetical protein
VDHAQDPYLKAKTLRSYMKLVSLFDEIEVSEKGDKAMGDLCYSTLGFVERDKDVFEEKIPDVVFDCCGRDYGNCLKRTLWCASV